jgi:hypothetical protein
VTKDPVWKKKKKIFHQDNVPDHKSVLALGKLRDCTMNCWNIHPIPQIWFTLTCLFPKLKTLPRCSAFFFESRGDCNCRGVFCRSYKEPLQGRENGAGINVLVLREIMLKMTIILKL